MSAAPRDLAARARARIEPDAYNPGFFRFFAWYVGRLLRRSFHAVRVERGSVELLAGLEREPGGEPSIVALSHTSWWDPLLCVYLSQRFTPTRPALAPIDSEQFAKFRFMRKLGLFGVDPEDPASLEPMVEYVARRCEQLPRTTFWITPQGRFADVREEILLRPGGSATAARLSASRPCKVVCLALEYAFWVDKRPEVFMRFEPCEAETATSTASWHRALTRAMQRNNEELAALVIARDPSAFESLEGGDAPRINPLYDMLLALRGKRTSLDHKSDSGTHSLRERVS